MTNSNPENPIQCGTQSPHLDRAQCDCGAYQVSDAISASFQPSPADDATAQIASTVADYLFRSGFDGDDQALLGSIVIFLDELSSAPPSLVRDAFLGFMDHQQTCTDCSDRRQSGCQIGKALMQAIAAIQVKRAVDRTEVFELNDHQITDLVLACSPLAEVVLRERELELSHLSLAD